VKLNFCQHNKGAGMAEHSQIYVNLPVKNLPQSRSFFESLGYSFNPEWSNEQGACLVLGENLFAMLLTEPFFQTSTNKPISP
jgi:predicted lactoylglutathione lyase